MKRKSSRRLARASQKGLRLSLDAGEMALAASGVITQRMLRLAAAASDPKRRADPELARMVGEKVEAVQEASVRVARKAARARPALSPEAQLETMLGLGEAWLAPFRTRVRRNARRLGRKRKA